MFYEEAEMQSLIDALISRFAQPRINGAFLYRNGPEWAWLPEWTTGMDIYMCPGVIFI